MNNMNGITDMEMYKGRTEYSSPYMKPYDFTDHDLILSQGPSYSGTTYQIKELLKSDRDAYGRVIMFSGKSSFKAKKDFAQIEEIIDAPFDDLTRYSKFVGVDNFIQDITNIKYHRYRCDGGGNLYDLMICDGIDTILRGFEEIPREERCIVHFMYAFQRSKRIIMTDTEMTKGTIAMIEYLKAKIAIQVQFVVNTYDNIKPMNIHVLGTAKKPTEVMQVKNTFINHLLKSLKMKKKVCVVTSNQNLKDQILLKSKTTSHIWSKDKENVKTWLNPEFKLVISTLNDIDFDKSRVFDNVYVYGETTDNINIQELMHMLQTVTRRNDNNIYIANALVTACNHM
jgi:Ni,Fe-hydrogenase III small subunit